jgi:hypothetical protein
VRARDRSAESHHHAIRGNASVPLATLSRVCVDLYLPGKTANRSRPGWSSRLIPNCTRPTDCVVNGIVTEVRCMTNIHGSVNNLDNSNHIGVGHNLHYDRILLFLNFLRASVSHVVSLIDRRPDGLVAMIPALGLRVQHCLRGVLGSNPSPGRVFFCKRGGKGWVFGLFRELFRASTISLKALLGRASSCTSSGVPLAFLGHLCVYRTSWKGYSSRHPGFQPGARQSSF